MSNTDETLPQPVVNEADQDVLTPEAGAGVTVMINPYTEMAAGDVVVLQWDGGIHQDEQVVTSQRAGKALQFSVPSEVIASNLGQSVQVSYTVTRSAGAQIGSEPLDLTVES
ncbi:hypothetical protein ACIBEA_06720 [Streptomyces sp. NPDC051555]|uniref:hypothetical protein n=1 Tax=Streptomyces sp. NPDC051555 TaxID=3365657 RepID=UPI0037BBDE3E